MVVVEAALTDAVLEPRIETVMSGAHGSRVPVNVLEVARAG